MRLATTQEIEYLGSFGGDATNNAYLIDELSRQLDALRRFDQFFCDADWQPNRSCNAAVGDSKKSAC